MRKFQQNAHSVHDQRGRATILKKIVADCLEDRGNNLRQRLETYAGTQKIEF